MFTCFKDLFEEYWKKETSSIDYLLVDYFIAIMYEHITTVNTNLTAVPPNNHRRDDLQAAMNAALPAEKFYDIVREDTVFYKLSWRETYSKYTVENTESVYGYFLRIDMGGEPA